MKTTRASALLGGLWVVGVLAAPIVDTTYPYTGPAIPVGDWVDPTVNGNGKGFPRLVEPPAVQPAGANPRNNVNVIALSYLPNGINIHFQTPFGLGVAPSVNWGTTATNLNHQSNGTSHTYDRTPPCSLVTAVTQCSQWFHEVQINSLLPQTTYYYQIPATNGTTASNVLNFTTARAAGDSTSFTVAMVNDMGYTNAAGTYTQLMRAINEGVAFAWHGGDISYADDWYSVILPCEDDWPVCYNGTSSKLAGGVIDDPDYLTPLPAGEVPNQGGPLGGDMSVLYESNWDLWQQWMNTITTKVPYMVLPGNHEATCAEFDGPNNELTAYLNDDKSNSTAPTSELTYYSCPPSQRNFTAYQNRFRMPGAETGGVGNFWYSFDYGLAHFVALDGETDFANSPEYPFVADLKGNETHPKESETYITDSGPFGEINGSYKDTTAYAQYKWLAKDLAGVNRTKTPWVIVMSHRPMYSSGVASYQASLRAAFQSLMLQNGVDAYFSGHIHWYERLFPLTVNGTVDKVSIVNNNTYYTNQGVSMTHIINGMAGNIESHSELSGGILNITAVLDTKHYGFSKLTILNATALRVQFVLGNDGSVGDQLLLLKKSASSGTTSSTTKPTSSISTSRSTSATSGVSKSVTTAVPIVPTTPGAIKSATTAVPVVPTTPSVIKSTTIAAPVVPTTPSAIKSATSTIPAVPTTPVVIKSVTTTIPAVSTTPSAIKSVTSTIPAVPTTPTVIKSVTPSMTTSLASYKNITSSTTTNLATNKNVTSSVTTSPTANKSGTSASASPTINRSGTSITTSPTVNKSGTSTTTSPIVSKSVTSTTSSMTTTPTVSKSGTSTTSSTTTTPTVSKSVTSTTSPTTTTISKSVNPAIPAMSTP